MQSRGILSRCGALVLVACSRSTEPPTGTPTIAADSGSTMIDATPLADSAVTANELDAPIGDASVIVLDAATSSSSRTFRISGIPQMRIHTHGGDAAEISDAAFHIEASTTPLTISVQSIDFLRDHGVGDCKGPASTTRKTLSPHSDKLKADGTYAPLAPIVVAANSKKDITVYFAPVAAYYVYCDTFGFRAHFLVNGEKVSALVNVNVMRVDPPRLRQ